MTSREPDFGPLEAGLGAMRARLGECPGAAALARFAADSLPPDEASRVRAHVSACGLCDRIVDSLREFDEPVSDAQPGWAATERRPRAKVFPKPRWQRWLLHPALAYGIALAAVIVAVIPARRPAPQTVTAPAPVEIQSLQTIDLNITRGASVPHAVLNPGDQPVALVFLIDIHPALHYQASLDGRAAQAVTSSDGKGNFAVQVSRALLGPGTHRLTVTEINPASGKVERSFDFPFQL